LYAEAIMRLCALSPGQGRRVATLRVATLILSLHWRGHDALVPRL
jgi:hypothetical protein